MLLGIRLYAKKGTPNLWKAIENDVRSFYSQGVTPLYALQEVGKKYITVVFEVKDLQVIQDFLTRNPTIQTATIRTRSIPLYMPYYFQLPKKHPLDLKRFTVFLRIEPANYKKVHSQILRLRFPKGIFKTFLSFSFGDDDAILSILAGDAEQVRKFVSEKIGAIEGVLAHTTSQVMRNQRLTSERKLSLHKKTLLYDKSEKSSERKKYEKELVTMTVIIRLFAKKELDDLWEDIENHVNKFETKDFIPFYASQQEANDYMTLVAEIRNFEALNGLFFQGIPSLINARKSRTYPLLKPVYFLLPKGHPKNLERYFIPIRAEPGRYEDIYSKIINFRFPKNVFMTYISYSLGYDDIIVSVLAESREKAESFAEKKIDPIKGVISYEVSNHLRTVRLASRRKWLAYRNRHLSSYDKEHRDMFDRRFDWSESEEYLATLADLSIRDLSQEG